MPLSWKESIGRTKVTCLICGFEGRALGIHLKSKHRLSVKEYRKQFNIPARLSLSSKNLQAKRSKAAKERSAAENLKIAREARKAKAAGPLS
jgi:predicted transcriptional regulator